MLTREEDNVKEKRVLVFWILLTACLGKRERDRGKESEREGEGELFLSQTLLSASADCLPIASSML